jgi:hypothetical protein
LPGEAPRAEGGEGRKLDLRRILRHTRRVRVLK